MVEELHSYIDTVIRTESQNNGFYSNPRVSIAFCFVKESIFVNESLFQSNDSIKSPMSLTNDDIETTKTLMKEVRFRLSHISLEPKTEQSLEHDV